MQTGLDPIMVWAWMLLSADAVPYAMFFAVLRHACSDEHLGLKSKMEVNNPINHRQMLRADPQSHSDGVRYSLTYESKSASTNKTVLLQIDEKRE